MFDSEWGGSKAKKLVIIYDKKSKMYADYLFQMISANNKIGNEFFKFSAEIFLIDKNCLSCSVY